MFSAYPESRALNALMSKWTAPVPRHPRSLLSGGAGVASISPHTTP